MRGLRRLQLRGRFLIRLLPVLVGSALAVGFLAHFLIQRHVDRQIHEDLSDRLDLRGLRVVGILRGLQHELRLTAGHLSRRPELADDLIDPLVEAWPQLERLYLLDRQPSRVEAQVWSKEGFQRLVIPAAVTPDWARPPDGDTTSSSQPRLIWMGEGRDRHAALRLVTPVPDREGQWLAAIMPQSTLSERFRGLSVRGEGFVVVLDAGGRVVYSNDSHFLLDQPIQDSAAECAPHIARSLFETDSAVEVCELGHSRVFIALHRDHSTGLHTAFVVPGAAVSRDLILLWRSIWGITLIMTVLASLIINRLVSRVVGPLRELSQTMTAAADGDLGQRVRVDGHDEVASVAHAFNRMSRNLDGVQETLRAQRRRLREALEARERLDHVKDSFLSLVSHEVRTPLTSILGGIEFLTDQHAELPAADQADIMEIIHESGQRLGSFMNDAILMASLQSRDGIGDCDEISLTALVQAELDSLETQAAERLLKVENLLGRQHEWIAWGDWTLLEIAVRKVLNNAVRFAHDAGTVEVRVVGEILEEEGLTLEALCDRVGPKPPGKEWRLAALRVFDTGAVVPLEKMEALFGKFELVHDIAHHQRGSGLSLPIASYILDQHGGTIVARSIEGRGMVFYLILPLRQAEYLREEAVEIPEGVDAVVETALRMRPGQDETREGTADRTDAIPVAID